MTSRAEHSDSPVIRVQGVSKAFNSTQALADVGLEVGSGEIHGLMGGNGSGKSTLMKILAGVYAADAGTLEIGGEAYDLRTFTPSDAKRCRLHMVHQHRTTFSTMTVAENLAIGRGFPTAPGGRIRWRANRRRAAALIERFGIHARPDDVIGELRPAAQTMVEIARALQDQEGVSDGILALDEPTAALPPREVEVLIDALRRYAAEGQAVLFVSHRLDEVMDLCHQVTVLRDGRKVGTASVDKLTRDGLVEMMIGRLVDAAPPELVRQDDRVPVLEARGLQGGAVKEVDCVVHAGEIVGIAGLAGSGRSTLLRLLFGAQRLDAGTIAMDGKAVHIKSPVDAVRAGIALVPEDRASDAAFPDLPVIDNFTLIDTPRFTRLGRVRRSVERTAAAASISRFGVKTSSPGASMRELSGGNQQKVSLGRWLTRAPRLLLLDEPTQGVDVGARADLWKLVAEAAAAGAAVLMVSSDLEELSHLSQRILVMRAGRLVGELEGQAVERDQINRALHALQVAA
jgi:ribose transport system ATP-binding protein